MALAQSASWRGSRCSGSSRRRADLHWLSSIHRCGCCITCSLEQGKVFGDSSESAALLQILSCVRLEEGVNPVVTVLHDAVAQHLGDLLESLFSLLACLSRRAIVR